MLNTALMTQSNESRAAASAVRTAKAKISQLRKANADAETVQALDALSSAVESLVKAVERLQGK